MVKIYFHGDYCKNVFHREGRQEREEIAKNINIHVGNLQENLRDLKLSRAAFASSR
jgi:hypothetical protein